MSFTPDEAWFTEEETSQDQRDKSTATKMSLGEQLWCLSKDMYTEEQTALLLDEPTGWICSAVPMKEMKQ